MFQVFPGTQGTRGESTTAWPQVACSSVKLGKEAPRYGPGYVLWEHGAEAVLVPGQVQEEGS